MPVQTGPQKNNLYHSPARRRKKLRFGLILGTALLVCAVLFALLLSFALPQAAEAALARGFQHSLQASSVQAAVQATSGWRLLGGKTESIELEIAFDDTSLLALSRLRAQWGPSNVALGLMRQGRGGARDAEPQHTELYWDETTLAAYLNRVQEEVLVYRVEISAEQVAVYGSITRAEGRHDIYLAGRPKSDDLGQVVFKAAEWQAEGLAQTEQLIDGICEALSFTPDLSPLAWKVWAKQVVLEPGVMLVYGSSSCCH
jgi:hypothetical protein